MKNQKLNIAAYYRETRRAIAMIKLYQFEIKRETNKYVLREMKRRLSMWQSKLKHLEQIGGFYKCC